MIYSTNNKPLVLTEDAADEFLEAVGVKLYEDEISINGTLYEGSYGESILEANGIFLYEDGIVLEGQYADAFNDWNKDRKHNKYKKEIDMAIRDKASVIQSANKHKQRFIDKTERNLANGKYKNPDAIRQSMKRSVTNFDKLSDWGRKHYDKKIDRLKNKDRKLSESSSIFSNIEII